ncbi:MAG: exodeoxyribonuclease V alpha subunit [Azoarcus sp.]|nr:exodeoxyribonuclease V alpha subunit [Azoarcus sp.]
MSASSFQLRVTAVRSRGREGGAIFSGVTEGGEAYVAVCDYHLIPDANLVEKGQVWHVCGAVSVRRTRGHKGFVLAENTIDVKEAELMRPAGRNIVAWIAECPDCAGIGQVKARKLYDRFGPALIEHIEHRRLGELTQVVSEESAQLLCEAFGKFKVSSALHWLDRVAMPRKIAMSVVAYYGEHAQARIEANPYVLISFEASWERVDEMARNRLSVAEDDPRRLTSAVEEVVYAGLAQGHTCLPMREVRIRLTRLLARQGLMAAALCPPENDTGVPCTYRQIEGAYQAAGLYLIESYVASRFHAMVAGDDDMGQVGLFAQIEHDPKAVAQAVLNCETAHGIVLSDEQKAAVMTSVAHRASLILGGAGTGKTTVLKALYEAFEASQPGLGIFQLALAGRAAQRMAQATGREAMTIAGFLNRIDAAQIDIGAVVVVDEASMVDVNVMYRLLRHLPGGVRLILVGDPSQLPPIGPGLVLHALVGLPSIPQTELKVVKRQSAASGIPQVAAAIRAHRVPLWADYAGQPGGGVAFVRCPPMRLEATVQEIYEQLGGRGTDFSVQILSITNGGQGGVGNLNTALHNRYQGGAEQVRCHDAEFGIVGARTLERLPLCVGDSVIFTENDYALGLRNGSLGRIVKAFPVVEPDDLCCVCEFEGVEYLLKSSHLEALGHAYSITIHKAQGSQFNRVIVPIRASRLLDQALIYTAVTRGIEQVVLVGNERAALDAIQAPASASRRHIALPTLLAMGENERRAVKPTVE